MSGKGSAPRPLSVDTKTYAARWEATFTPDAPPAPPSPPPRDDDEPRD